MSSQEDQLRTMVERREIGKKGKLRHKELFEQLHQSMKEAVAIAKGEMQPSRVFTVARPDVKAVREKTS